MIKKWIGRASKIKVVARLKRVKVVVTRKRAKAICKGKWREDWELKANSRLTSLNRCTSPKILRSEGKDSNDSIDWGKGWKGIRDWIRDQNRSHSSSWSSFYWQHWVLRMRMNVLTMIALALVEKDCRFRKVRIRGLMNYLNETIKDQLTWEMISSLIICSYFEYFNFDVKFECL